ncbi:response regulator [Nodosilinea sp. E11]|uniref:response regulator n=1 Tax=Nodosilinea sp. E11 TaxID=3037479 RepID=UPI00293496B6|nr:response regulator [Nodosilinea sp. E11]WOD37658.1 response regulator [Nodosilinea sp. E11]
MNDKSVQYSKPLAYYLQVKKLKIFSVLKHQSFSGELFWSSPTGHHWTLFINQGQVLYGTGGVHPIRQWYRQVRAHAPELDLGQLALPQGATSPSVWLHCWDYHLLLDWFRQGYLSKKALGTIIANIIADILFDVVQSRATQYQLTRYPALDPNQAPIYPDNTERLFAITDLWQSWLEVGLEAYSPNLAPVIVHPEKIQTHVSPQVYTSLIHLLDGQRSLRDLAVKLGQDVLTLTQVLQPYIRAGWISLVEIADYAPVIGAGLNASTVKNAGNKLCDRSVTIACVDDSPMVCQTLGQVIRAADYNFVAITEGVKAIPILLAQKPDLIFLDLVMPDASGYEICSNLRKISYFKNVPIIILSGNDGLVDQVRARLLGATDFLSKPIEPIVILSVIQKYLKHLIVA